jgi:hypothetical protein
MVGGRRRKGMRTSAEYAAATRRRISDVWQDTMTLLTDTISAFPVELIRLVGDFAKPNCIYWASYASSKHIKFWQLSLDTCVPQLVVRHSLRDYKQGRMRHTADGYTGSFYLFWSNFAQEYAVFHFDAQKLECTTVCSLQKTLHVDLRYVTVIYGYNKDGAKMFNVISNNELWLLSINNNTNKPTWTIGPRDNSFRSNWTLAVGFLGGVIVANDNGQVVYYHPDLSTKTWISLPTLNTTHPLELFVVGECLSAITDDNCKLYVLKLDWNDIVRISNSQSIDYLSTWQQIQTVIPDWILRHSTAQYYLTSTSVVFCSQRTVDQNTYSRTTDRPPPPKHIARLDLPTCTTVLWH